MTDLRDLAARGEWGTIFHQIEAFRVRMRVPMEAWAQGLGVSRGTYSRWVNRGGPMRMTNVAQMESMLASIVVLLRRGWLESKHMALTDRERGQVFIDALKEVSASLSDAPEGQM